MNNSVGNFPAAPAKEDFPQPVQNMGHNFFNKKKACRFWQAFDEYFISIKYQLNTFNGRQND